MKYRKKPIVVEAIQWTGNNVEEVMRFIESEFKYEPNTNYATKKFHYWANIQLLSINTLEGNMQVSKNDYIIKGVNGEFYPCKPDIFEKAYERVEE